MSLEATSGFRLLDNFRGQGLVFKEILKRPYSGFCENGRIWSIMIWSYCLYYVYTIPWTICLWNSKLYQPLTPQFHIDIPWKSANKNSTLTHQSERWCPPQPTIDFESNKTASCYQMLFNKHMSHEQWTKTWLCRVYRKSYCPVLWGIMINITIRIQWSLSKTTSIMESIRVCCRWLTSHHITWSELSLRERQGWKMPHMSPSPFVGGTQLKTSPRSWGALFFMGSIDFNGFVKGEFCWWTKKLATKIGCRFLMGFEGN